MKLKTFFNENTVLRVVYLLVFLFVIFNDAIYSPDTRSYIHALPYRHPGYVLFLKTFKVLFSSVFDLSVLVFQAGFGLLAVHFFFKTTAKIFNLNTLSKVIVVALLLFPFFNPLFVANNICPEGFSYPLYLFFIGSSLRFIQHDNYKILWAALVLYVLLSLTRGQFIITPLIFGVAYILKNKKHFFKKPILIKSLLLIFIPAVVVVADSSYHKLKDGIFGSTPFGFVAASGSAFFVSEQTDSHLISNKDDKAIFNLCYNKLSNENLLLSSQSNLESYSAYYDFFHNHVPPICNRTVHNLGKAYYYDKLIKTNTIESADAQAFYNIEKTCKNITLILIENNFSKWIKLYFANISHGFFSPILLILVIISLLFSSIKLLYNHKNYLLLFICSALTLSNAALIAFASHSIMRYLFYNYVLIFLIFVIIISKLIKNGIKH
ncbi:glycosyltransferase family protein [Psychroserpens damuponensis]|uniref:glycosyltransferase family 39 protein n=1 Tax=Psychroserpens damuponensis TaxID=943936 RepID=UPI00058B440F|nr:glycosyltransferase family 39 protein [Psychroserpens damuponensis]